MFPETKTHRMSEETLEILIKQAMAQSGQQISIGWQGGEPTLMGLPFFKKAIELQKKHGRGKVIGNGLQTNGLLFDEQWARFLARNKFLVGLSIDGPEHIHDHYRFMSGGQGSWSKVLEKGKLLLDGGVEVNALTVVNDYSVKFPEEIYNFHKDLGLTFMQFIPCVEPDPEDSKRAAPFSVSGEGLGEFYVKLFDLWLSDFVDGVPQTSVRFFDSVFYHYVDMAPPECTLLEECGIYVVVEHNGDVYSCDFFVEPEWKLGNIKDDLLIDLLNSERQAEFGKIKSDLPGACKKCEWLDYCRGGCTKDRLRDPSDKKLNHFCTAFKMFFEHADPQLKAIAKKWKEEHGIQDVSSSGPSGKSKPGRNDSCPCGSGLKYKRCCGK
jgi:uncharacterized protein